MNSDSSSVALFSNASRAFSCIPTVSASSTFRLRATAYSYTSSVIFFFGMAFGEIGSVGGAPLTDEAVFHVFSSSHN
jgi:hypothetical protein